MSSRIEFYEEGFRLKSLYLAKSVHELKNVFITISCIIENNFESTCLEMKDLLNSNMKFLKTLSEFGMFLIQDITKVSKTNFYSTDITSNTNKIFSYKKETTESFNLLKCLNFCIKMFQFRAIFEKKNIEISLKIDKSLKTKIITTINESRLKQIIINLLSNSYKFTLHGFITLNCFLTKEEKIRIKIMDSGLGFNKEDVKIFSPFQMNSQHQFLNKNGSGLGLLIVKELCESFNSKINYNSIKGKGTEFWFDIENYNKDHIIIDQNCIFTSSLKEMLSDINLGKKDNDPNFNYVEHEHESFSDEIIDNNTDSFENESENSDKDNNIIIINNNDDNNNNNNNKEIHFNIDEKDVKINKKYRHSHQFKKIIFSKNSSINNLTNKKRHSIMNNNNLSINKIIVCQKHLNLIQSNKNFKHCLSEEKISMKMDSILNKLKILICDDESFTAISTRNVVLKYFKSKKNKNYNIPDIIFAQNGLECIHKLYKSLIEESLINIVLMDENMPFLNGSNTCAFIKSIFEFCHVQIYIISSSYVNIKECNADGFFDKPLNVKNMKEIMLKI